MRLGGDLGAADASARGCVRRNDRSKAGSGKTTFATRLGRLLPAAVVIEIDDFLNWSDLDDWWPRLEKEAVAPLLGGGSAHFRIRDWDADPLGVSLDGWRDVGPTNTIILDGVTSSRSSIAQRLLMSFWLEAPPDVCLARGVARDGEPMRSVWQNWMRLEDEFFERDDAPGRATYLVAGDAAATHDEEAQVVLLGAAVELAEWADALPRADGAPGSVPARPAGRQRLVLPPNPRAHVSIKP
jgi:hypothetical protein